MLITSKLEIDLRQPGFKQIAYAVQGDSNTRALEISLFSGGLAWEIPPETTMVVFFNKGDGTGGSYDTLPDGTAAGSISGNVVTVTLAPQVLTAPGPVELVVGFISGDTKLHTFLVYLDVQPNPGLQVTSENYFKVSGALADSGWAPNMYLGTDENGRVVVKSAPSGDGGQTGGVTFFPFVDSEGNLSWSNNGGLENPETVNIKGADGTPGEPGADGATVQEVLEEMPTVTAMDFSNFENGSFTETVDGVTVTHTVTFDTQGRPSKIDNIAITWEAVT